MRKTLAVFALVLGVLGLGVVPALAAGNCGSYTLSSASNHGNISGKFKFVFYITHFFSSKM